MRLCAWHALHGHQPSWDVGKVTSMVGAFFDARLFNSPISAWDVGRVVAMCHMFYQSLVFNADISGWQTSR